MKASYSAMHAFGIICRFATHFSIGHASVQKSKTECNSAMTLAQQHNWKSI